MRERPTVVLVHGGPGSFDHSYFKPDFARLPTSRRSSTSTSRPRPLRRRRPGGVDASSSVPTPSATSATTLGISRPIVLGHSLGGFVAMRLRRRGIPATRRPGAPVDVRPVRPGPDRRGLPPRRRRRGRRHRRRSTTASGAVTDAEWDPSSGCSGPVSPEPTSARDGRQPRAERAPGWTVMRGFDVVDQLARIDCPTLVVRRRARPDHAGRPPPARSPTRYAAGRRAPRDDRGRRALHMAGCARPLLAAHHGIRQRGRHRGTQPVGGLCALEAFQIQFVSLDRQTALEHPVILAKPARVDAADISGRIPGRWRAGSRTPNDFIAFRR